MVERPEDIREGQWFGRIKLLGELAQLVERLHGMQEVTGSNPVFSTKQIPPIVGFAVCHVCCLHTVFIKCR